MNSSGVCKGADRLLFSCSGAADVGEVADRAVRHLAKDGIGKMYCLAGVGGSVEPIIATVKSAEERIVIDGCPMDCAKKIMDNAGIASYKYLRITDLGFAKGQSPATDSTIQSVAEKAKQML